jgi:FixJ family two-component response regulator
MNSATETGSQAPAPVILVADEDPAVLNSLEFALGVDGYDVWTYSSAAALVDAATDTRGGCVVADYHLPDINGMELARKLRARGVGMPVILVTTGTALPPTGPIEGVSILEKPFDTELLRSAIRTAVRAEVPATYS